MHGKIEDQEGLVRELTDFFDNLDKVGLRNASSSAAADPEAVEKEVKDILVEVNARIP